MFICARIVLAGPPESNAVPAIALDLLVCTERFLPNSVEKLIELLLIRVSLSLLILLALGEQDFNALED